MNDKDGLAHIIKEIEKAASQIAKGNFDVAIPSSFNGEVEDLRKSFNKMIESIKKTVQDLSSAKHRYQSLYEGSPDLYRSVNSAGIIIDCNKAYARHLGYTKDDLIGKSVFDHIAENSLDDFRRLIEEWRSNARVVNKEIWLKRKDGTTFPGLLSSTWIYDSEGNIIGSNTIIKDITEIYDVRKKLEESQRTINYQLDEIKEISELRLKAELKYRNFYDGSPDLYRSANSDGIIVDCNTTYAKYLGYTKDDVIGKSVFDHIAENSLDDFRRLVEEWSANAGVVNKEIWLKRKDGTTFPGLLSSTALYDNEGRLVGSNTVIRDITEIYDARRKLEEREIRINKQLDEIKEISELRLKAELKYRNFYDGSPDLYRSANSAGIIVDCNTTYAKYLGYTKDDVIGKSVFDHIAENSLDDFRRLVEEWSANAGVVNKEIWLKRKDGTTFPGLLSSTALYDNEGRLVGSNTVIRDITEIYDARRKLIERIGVKS